MSLRRDDDAIATAFEIPVRRRHGWNYNYFGRVPESGFLLLGTMIYTRYYELI